jgi:hypothetical protein
MMTTFHSALLLLCLPTLAGAMTDAEYESKFTALSRAEGEKVRVMEERMGMNWLEMVDMDEDKVVTVEEMHHMALMPDEENEETMATVKALREHYLSKPANKKAWEAKSEIEYGEPSSLNEQLRVDPFEWFKHSGFFAVYLNLYDKDGDGKATTAEMKCALDGCVEPMEM